MIFVEKTERADPVHRYLQGEILVSDPATTRQLSAPLDNRRMFSAHVDANP